MKKLLKKWRNAAAVSAAAVGISIQQAHAAYSSVVPADFATDMAAVNADILAIGVALIGLAVTAVGIKWVKATFFG